MWFSLSFQSFLCVCVAGQVGVRGGGHLTVLIKVSSTIFKRARDGGQPCLVPNF